MSKAGLTLLIEGWAMSRDIISTRPGGGLDMVCFTRKNSYKSLWMDLAKSTLQVHLIAAQAPLHQRQVEVFMHSFPEHFRT